MTFKSTVVDLNVTDLGASIPSRIELRGSMAFKVCNRETPSDESEVKYRSERIFRALLDMGMTHAVGVPDNFSRLIFDLCDKDPKVRTVPVCREGEAWSIASGLWVGGATPVVIIQNTGFFESGDALRGTAIEMGVPLVALLTYRGYRSLGTDLVDSAASFFEPMLKAWEMPYRNLEEGDEAEVFRAAKQEAKSLRKPVGVLML